MLALVRLKGLPLSARATQLTLRPPVFGTRAVPLTVKLWRLSKSVGPSFRSRCMSSRTWKLLSGAPLPEVLPRDLANVYDTCAL